MNSKILRFSRLGVQIATSAACAVLASAAWPETGRTSPPVQVEVTGTLVDVAGEVPAGAEVALVLDTAPYESRRAWFAGGRTEPVEWSRVGKDGRFTLRARPGFHLLLARATGHAEVGKWLAPLISAQSMLRLVLPTVGDLRVQVSGAGGEPLPGALVVVREQRQRGMPRHRSSPMVPRLGVDRTGEDGSAALGALDDGVRTVYLAAEGHAPKVVSDQRSDRLDVRLERGVRSAVEARLGGRPHAGALILAGDLAVPLAVTDEEGHATVFVAPGEPLEIEVLGPEGATGSAVLSVASEMKADGTEEGRAAKSVVIRLEPPVPVEGRVVDARTHEGIPGAWVWYGTSLGYLHTRSDRHGSYRLSAIIEKPYVAAAADGYLAARIRSRDESGPTLALELAGRLTGRVVDTGGHPVSEVEVQASSDRRRRRRGLVRWASSDAAGRFGMDSLPRGAAVSLVTKKAGFAPAEIAVMIPEVGAGEPIEIVLQRGRTAFGQVVDTAERPVAEASVRLRPSPPGDRVFSPFEEETDPRVAVTDRQGRFRFEDLGEQAFDLVIGRTGYAAALVSRLRLPPGESSVDLGAIVLLDGVRLVGVVVDPDGAPLEGAEIVAIDRPAAYLTYRDLADIPTATSGQDGRFAVDDLRPASSINVSASLEGFVSVYFDHRELPNEEPLRIVMVPAATIEGVVVDEDSMPVPKARIRGLKEQGGSGRSHAWSAEATDAEGRFRLVDLSPGRWTVSASAPGSSGEVTGIEVAAGSRLGPLRIVVDAGYLVRGRVISEDGTPVSGAMIRQVTEQGLQSSQHRPRTATTDGDGRYRIEGLPRGRQSLYFGHAKYREVLRDILLEAGETRLDVTLERGLSVAGMVVDQAGNPVAGAQLAIETTSSRVGFSLATFGADRVRSAADGRFEIVGLESGELLVRASKEGFAPAESTVELAAQSVRGIVLRLASGGTIVGRVRGVAFEDLPSVMVMVKVKSSGQARSMVARLDHEGAFRVEHVPVGDLMVTAMRAGSGFVRQTVTLPADGGEVAVELEFGDRLGVSGVVLRGGEPMSGLSVSARGIDVSGNAGSATDSRGRFRLVGLESGRYEINVQRGSSGHSLARREVEVGAEDDLVIEVSTTTISGRIVESDTGSGIAGASLRLEASETAVGARYVGMSLRRLRSSPDGTFRVSNVPSGRWRLVAEKGGYASTVRDLEVIFDTPIDGLEVVLEAGAGILLTAVRSDGRPAAEISVAAFDAADRPLIARTYAAGENGQVRIQALPNGSSTLWVGARDTASTRVEVRLPGPPVTVHLAVAGELRVKVPAASGIGRAVLTLSDARGRVRVIERYGRVSERWDLLHGEATISLPPGPVRLAVELSDGTRLEGQAVIVSGRMTEVELR